MGLLESVAIRYFLPSIVLVTVIWAYSGLMCFFAAESTSFWAINFKFELLIAIIIQKPLFIQCFIIFTLFSHRFYSQLLFNWLTIFIMTTYEANFTNMLIIYSFFNF